MFQTAAIPGTYPRSPSEKAFDLVMHILLGLYLWEWFISLDFDWQYISRKKPFLWPLTFYFVNRYFMLVSISGIVSGVDVTGKINCQALYDWNIFFGASAIGLASVNLSLRTMAVWSRPWYIVTPLVVLILGHFGLLLHALTIGARWFQGKGCVTIYANGPVLMATFIYTMCFDFIILSLMAIRLYNTSAPGSNSRLRNLIFKDGLIYFIIVFLMNLVATIVISLHRDPAISIITSPPSAVMSTIVAGRVVRRLNKYASGSSTHPTITLTHVTAPIAFRPRSNVSANTTDKITLDSVLSSLSDSDIQKETRIPMVTFAEGSDRSASQAVYRRSIVLPTVKPT